MLSGLILLAVSEEFHIKKRLDVGSSLVKAPHAVRRYVTHLPTSSHASVFTPLSVRRLASVIRVSGA